MSGRWTGLRYWFKDGDEWFFEPVYEPILRECVSEGKPWIWTVDEGSEVYGVGFVAPSGDGRDAKRGKKASA